MKLYDLSRTPKLSISLLVHGAFTVPLSIGTSLSSAPASFGVMWVFKIISPLSTSEADFMTTLFMLKGALGIGLGNDLEANKNGNQNNIPRKIYPSLYSTLFCNLCNFKDFQRKPFTQSVCKQCNLDVTNTRVTVWIQKVRIVQLISRYFGTFPKDISSVIKQLQLMDLLYSFSKNLEWIL